VQKVSEEYAPDGKYFGKKAWHWQLCKHFIGAHDEFLPDGSVLIIPEPSSDLEPDKFSDFMTAVEEWANARGVWLDD
jgi:hypothetical protein